MSYATHAPIRSDTEPTVRRYPEQATPLSIRGSPGYDSLSASIPAPTGRRASGARRTSARGSSLTIPEDIPLSEPASSHPGGPARPGVSASPWSVPPPLPLAHKPSPQPMHTSAAAVPAPVRQHLELAPPSPARAPPSPQPRVADPKPAASIPSRAAVTPRPSSQPVAARPVATKRTHSTPTGTGVPAAANKAFAPRAADPAYRTTLRLSPRGGAGRASTAICTPQETKELSRASIDSLVAEKRRLERLSLAVTEEIQSREFTEAMYTLLPRGNQFYEADTCIRRIAGEAFDFSSPAEIQVALQMTHKNARLTEKNSMFAGAMMTLTSLTNTGTAVESLENFNRFYAQGDAVMTDQWKQSYVTAMRHIVIGFQANPDSVLDQFGHHVARLLQHEQLYIALLRHSQGRPLESPAPHLDAEWSPHTSDEESETGSSSSEYDDDYSDTTSEESESDGARQVPVQKRTPVAQRAAPATRGSPSPAALPPRPTSTDPSRRPSVNTFNETDGRPPSHSPRVNEANRRAHLTPVVGRGTEAAAASAAVRPGAPPAVVKTMPEPLRRSSSVASDGNGPTTLRDRHRDPYPDRGDSPEARPQGHAAAAHTSHAATAFVPPVPRPHAPPLPQHPVSSREAPIASTSSPAQPPLAPPPKPLSRHGSGTYDAGYFRQSSLNGSLSRSAELGGFVLRNQEGLSRQATPTRGGFSRNNSTHTPAGTAPAAATQPPQAAPPTARTHISTKPVKSSPAVTGTTHALPLSRETTGAGDGAAPRARTARKATAPVAANSVERSPGGGQGEADTLPPTMSKRQSREKQQQARQANALQTQPRDRALSDYDPADKPPPRAADRPASQRTSQQPPRRAPSPAVHQHGVRDEGSPIPGVPDTVYSQRAVSPQASRAATPRRESNP